MKKIFLIAPWIADFGHGIIITVILLLSFGIEPTISYFLLGLLFSIIPDTDGILEFLRFKNVGASKGRAKDHRDGIHFPIIWLLIGLIIIYFDSFVGTLFTICTMAHFFNDSWGTGWGVKWLWPFSKKSYKLFTDTCKDASVCRRNKVVSWLEEEKQELMEKLGNPNWLQDVYMKKNIISVIEYGTFLLSLIILFVYLNFVK